MNLAQLQAGFEDLRNRVSELERKIDGVRTGYTCLLCHEERPGNWYIYEATKGDEVKRPVCGKCAQNPVDGWGFNGPFPASAA